MPVPSSSRRKPSRRQNSEDIEEDNATQRRPTEDEVDSEGEGQRLKRPKTEKKPKKAAVTQDSDEDDASSESDHEDERIDVSQLQDQPLTKESANHLRGLVEDWAQVSATTIAGWQSLQDIAVAVADAYTDEDAARKPIQDLDDIMRELMDLSAEMQCHSEAVNELRQKIATGEAISDGADRYLEGAAEKKADYLKKTTRQKYAKEKPYVEFRTAIWDTQNPGTPMPPLTDFIKKEDGDDSDDDDLEIGGQTQDFKCPISLTILEDPMTSKLCGHSYSGNAIRAMLHSTIAKPCPTAGCRHRLKLSDCVPDPELAKKARRYAQRIARQEEQEHSDADEVID